MKKYIIYTPKYNENSGGVIAMHRLCHLLNESGQEAYLWKHPNINNFEINKEFNTPTIYTDSLNDFIVIYMESVAGNPLDAPHVIRWFLNKPGFFTNKILYGKYEYYFYYQKVFYDKQYIENEKDKLHIFYYPTNLYKKTNHTIRNGSCYMMRKEKNRTITHKDKNSVCLDGLSHQEIAKIFNEKEFFYCYDLYSAYTAFAALCGCIPIVIPKDGISSKEWHEIEYYRYGVAYGVDDIEYAIKTLHKTKLTFRLLNESIQKDLNNFITTTQNYFISHKKSLIDIQNEKLDYIKKLNKTKNKIVFFGASESLIHSVNLLEFNGIKSNFICDNDENKFNKNILNMKIFNPNILFKKDYKFDVLITSIYVKEITEQLKKYNNIKNIYSIYGY